MSGSRRITVLATLGLIAMTAVWGSTFVLIKNVLTRMPVADFLAVRFAIAALAMLLLFGRAAWRLGGPQILRGLLLGTIFGCGQLLQTWGLSLILPSVSGFVTGMYVVFTPILALLLLRQRMAGVGPVGGDTQLGRAGRDELGIAGRRDEVEPVHAAAQMHDDEQGARRGLGGEDEARQAGTRDDPGRETGSTSFENSSAGQ